MDIDGEIKNIDKQDTNNQNHDYDFLHDDKKSVSTNTNTDNNGNVMEKFDEAFNKASQEVQEYILSDEFPENIKLICKLQKLEDEKENVIIENVAVSILVGLLSTHDAKNTLMESFKASGILIEELNAGMILKDIDAYILSHVRKQILKSKIADKEIRHLTLKEERLEKEKEELRKILLANTGNVNERGNVFEYKKKEIQNTVSDQSLTYGNWETKQKVSGHDRESLLAKININPGDLSDKEKLKERMMQIKGEELKRLSVLEKEKEEELAEKTNRENLQKEISEMRLKEKQNINLEENEISEIMKKRLEEKIESGEKENFNLDKIIKERESEELSKERNEKKRVASEEDAAAASEDPYRESM